MSVEVEIGPFLRDQGWHLVTAESCTGGLVAHRVTNVPGSSDYFLGGVVVYANELKEALLEVRHETLAAAGAVSEPVAREMVRGARARLGADVAVAITGIAGPTGGTAEKPVGLGYIALAAPGVEVCQRHVFHGDRLENKAALAGAALQLLLGYLEGRQIDG
ncbi:MAG: CinA family protein [Anaerolineae bacterium]